MKISQMSWLWALGVIVAVLLADMKPAYAYIDPGAGSYFLQLLLAGILGGAFVLKAYWERVKSAVRRVFGPQGATDNQEEPNGEK